DRPPLDDEGQEAPDTAAPPGLGRHRAGPRSRHGGRGVRDRGRRCHPEGTGRVQRALRGPGGDPQGPAAVRAGLHHLPRPQPAGCAGPRAVADRRRRGRGVLPGGHRPDAGRPPGGPGRAQGAVLRRGRDAADRGVRAVRRRRRGDPDRQPARQRREPGRGRRAVPAQLRLLPQLRRPRRRPLGGQVRPADGPGERPHDLDRDAHRPAEHAGLRGQPAHRGAEAGDHQLRADPEGARRPGRRPDRPDGPGPGGPGRLGRRHRSDHADDPLDRSEVV
ncbi:MAG: Ubiquinol-cytochrome C reductase, diheme cytochrome cc subunit, partial [uncultured Corynebacteriales bacterium]